MKKVTIDNSQAAIKKVEIILAIFYTFSTSWYHKYPFR